MLIRDQSGFESSIFHKLDLLLSNVADYVRNHFGTVENIAAVMTDGTFIALAAPSMEGKTQSAFIFRLVKPLYFPLSGLRSSGIQPQPIYKNFAHLADAILGYASLDLGKIRSLKPNMDVPKLNEFDNSLRSCDFWTLGFLCHLVEDGRNISEDYWMRYHAERPDFEFKARSIRSIEDGFFNGFFLFLDEFRGNEAGLFIRNLARVSNLTCMVANTNSRISNLTKGLTSGGNGISIWSLVACQLNLPENYTDIYYLNTILDQIRNSRRIDFRIETFINDFLRNQAKYLRPGVSKFLKEGLLILNDNLVSNPDHRLNIRQFMDKIVYSLQTFLGKRKPSLESEDISHWAKIGLLFPTSFNFSNLSSLSSEEEFHQSSFLEYHLYHLVNPTDIDDWLFMTFAPRNNRKELMIDLPNRTEWSNQYTYFKREELLTILSCLWFPFAEPVTAILKSARKSNTSDPSAISDMPNVNAIKLPGNVLEISAAVSLVDASHHSFERRGGSGSNSSQVNTFAGQNGVDFIKNILVNMIDDLTVKKALKFSIQFSHDDLTNFLSRCHIPFLYGIDRRIEILDRISDSESSVFFDSLIRPSDDKQVDSYFKFKYDSDYSIMTAECKNRKEKMTSDKLEKILKKSLNMSGKVCLVFCNEFIEIASDSSKFMRLCRAKSINVYRIRRTQYDPMYERSYLIEPFSNVALPSPQSICILFESRRVNAPPPKR